MKATASTSAVDFFLKLWLGFCAGSALAGWALSLAGWLNGTAYALLAAAGLVFTIGYARRQGGMSALARCRRGLGHCWRRGWLPRLWLLGMLAAALGGILHAPNNYDALTYRFPRLLQWLAEGRWHWIHTANPRMNYSACGFEWLMTPLFALTHSDRFFFLLNLAPCLLLPGLLFCVFRGLGVRRSAAWHWMWLLPGGYCYLLQAGSIANDAFATLFLLAAIHFSLRAETFGSPRDLAWSIIAAALLTSAKASNLPLLLPWAVALWPARRLLGSRAVLLAGGLALLVSFAPTAWLNQRHAGHWNGNPADQEMLRARNPWAGIAGNSIQLAVQNLAPPLNPYAGRLNEQLLRTLTGNREQWLARHFPRFHPGLSELPQEETAGVGWGVSLLAGVGLLVALRHRRRSDHPAGDARRRLGLSVALAGATALLFFMTQLASEATARLVTPYYPLLLLFVLLLPEQDRLTRQGWWRALAVTVASIALLIVVLTPSRPLWPAQTVWSWLAARHPDQPLLRRAATAYLVYARRPDNLAALRADIPPGTRRIGFLARGDESDISLWRPFDGRRVWHFRSDDPWDEFRRRGIQVLVVQRDALGADAGTHLPDLLTATGGRLAGRHLVTLKARNPAEEWWVIALPPT